MITTRTRLTAAALAAVLALSACAGESAPEAAPEPAAASGAPDPGTSDLDTSTPASRAEDWPRTVSVGGAELTLDAPPARIVATSTEVGDLALELVGHERVAAVSAGSATEGTGNQLDAARRVATVLPAGNDPDTEKLLSLEPDLVLLVGRHAGEHDALLQQGWHIRTWKAGGGYALTDEAIANAKSETLWCSPHCMPQAQEPASHDLFAEVAHG